MQHQLIVVSFPFCLGHFGNQIRTLVEEIARLRAALTDLQDSHHVQAQQIQLLERRLNRKRQHINRLERRLDTDSTTANDDDDGDVDDLDENEDDKRDLQHENQERGQNERDTNIETDRNGIVRVGSGSVGVREEIDNESDGGIGGGSFDDINNKENRYMHICVIVCLCCAHLNLYAFPRKLIACKVK